jgi:hypothetical protein
MVSGDIAAGFWRGQSLPHAPDANMMEPEILR